VGQAPKRRLLVVEDEFMLATKIADLLEEAGYEVAGPVRNVREAMRIVGLDGVDGAVLDISLQNEISLPLADALASMGAPVLFVTGYAKEYLAATRPRAQHLEKPFTDQELVERVDQLFEPRAS
jgi:DNA-binding response OmpR family regulator